MSNEKTFSETLNDGEYTFANNENGVAIASLTLESGSIDLKTGDTGSQVIDLSIKLPSGDNVYLKIEGNESLYSLKLEAIGLELQTNSSQSNIRFNDKQLSIHSGGGTSTDFEVDSIGKQNILFNLKDANESIALSLEGNLIQVKSAYNQSNTDATIKISKQMLYFKQSNGSGFYILEGIHLSTNGNLSLNTKLQKGQEIFLKLSDGAKGKISIVTTS